MKIQIRHGVFETNSSSCHSLSIKNRTDYDYDQLKKYVDDYDNTIHVGFGEFGWEQEWYIDAFTKLEYALTMIIETECRNISNVEEFYESDGFNELNNLIKDRCDCDGITLISEMEFKSYHPSYWDYRQNKWVEELDTIISYVDHDGYIDHQSCEGYANLQGFLDDYSVTLEDFIFNTGIKLIIDNDNH